jgi:hypothetical protein
MLGIADATVARAVVDYQARLADEVRSQDASLQRRSGD